MASTVYTLPLTLLPPLAGAGSSPDVGNLYDCAIGGTGYMLDWTTQNSPLVHTSADLLRDQADSGSTVGEQSINPEGPWRRTIDSWHLGAGQANQDRVESNPARFLSSYGIDPWTKSEASLLPTTGESLTSSSTNLYMATAGTRVYVADNQTLKYSSDPFDASPTWTTVTGTPASAIASLTSDGYNVYASYDTNGIYETDTSKSTAASWVTGTVGEVEWVRGRFMASNGASIYNVTKAVGSAAAALPPALYTHRNADFSWVGFAESANHIYAAGFSGDKSEIYRISITNTGASLAAPTSAAQVPDGEKITAIYGYLGFILIGTTVGVRFATPDENGDLILGAPIEIGQTVRCFEGQGQYVWFGWENSHSTGSGLGRIDLKNFADSTELLPSYAPDLLHAATGNVNSIVTLDEKRLFSVAGEGVIAEDTDKALFAELISGSITYGISEEKTALDFLLTADFTDGGGIGVYISADEGDFSLIGTATSTGTSRILADEARGNRFRVKVLFVRSTGDATKGPTLISGTLRAYPRVETTNYITASLYLLPLQKARNGDPIHYDPEVERANIDALRRSQTITTFQEGNLSWPVLVDSVRYRALPPPSESSDAYGVLDVRMKVVA